MLEGDSSGSVTHQGQVTDLEMIYRCSCDTVLTRLTFTMGLFPPFSPFHLPLSLMFPVLFVLCLSFTFSHQVMLECWIFLKALPLDRSQITGQKIQRSIAAEKSGYWPKK